MTTYEMDGDSVDDIIPGKWVRFVEGFKVFLSERLNVFSFGLTLLLIFVAILAPWIAPYPYDEVNPSYGMQPPSFEHLMGTEYLCKALWGFTQGQAAYIITAQV